MTALPLSGIRVLDIGSLIAGPFAATMLGDFGAEVIKVEQPGAGDALRGTPVDGKAVRSPNWLVEGRNKKCVTLNLRVPAGQAILRDLVRHADVLIENFTPGTMEKWSLGWPTLQAINPRLIMVRVSGYGQTGPNAKRAGYDRIALGFSGYMYPTGFPDRYPVRPAFPTADYNTGTFAALAAMFALYQRDAQGGEGQMIDLALYEPTFRITGDMLTKFARTGAIRERIGNRNPTFAPAGTFETKDGRFVQIAAGGDKVWQRLAEATGIAGLATDPRYLKSRDRIARADELEKLLADWIAEHDFAEVEARLVPANVRSAESIPPPTSPPTRTTRRAPTSRRCPTRRRARSSCRPSSRRSPAPPAASPSPARRSAHTTPRSTAICSASPRPSLRCLRRTG